MSGPRTKRQFAGAASDPAQRQITSFFKTSSSAISDDATPASAKSATLNGPALPPQVQTDLLTVGMRVRKAIPEGYKTHDTYGGFQLWTDDRSSVAVPHTNPAASTAAFNNAMRELEPFCGINKVGGLAFQPASSQQSMDEMPGLTSSQDTVSSTSSSFTSRLNIPPPSSPFAQSSSATTVTLPSHPRKRVFLAEEEEALSLSTPLPHTGPFRLSNSHIRELDDEISPRTMAPPPGMWDKNTRVLAMPRRGKHQAQMMKNNLAAVAGMGMGMDAEEVEQENIMVVVRQDEGGNDFEEASFLDYRLRSEEVMDIE